MELDYRQIWDLTQVRKKQIEDAALELDRFNTEDRLLNELQGTLRELMLLDRKQWDEVPAVGKTQSAPKEQSAIKEQLLKDSKPIEKEVEDV
jgi:hypothetical protein